MKELIVLLLFTTSTPWLVIPVSMISDKVVVVLTTRYRLNWGRVSTQKMTMERRMTVTDMEAMILAASDDSGYSTSCQILLWRALVGIGRFLCFV